MVWGGVCASGKTPLHFVQPQAKINASYYQECVEGATPLDSGTFQIPALDIPAGLSTSSQGKIHHRLLQNSLSRLDFPRRMAC
jgi:hypothetical protein